ncbi:polysaccharide deacetylase family protein [Paenibacillus lutrae]|uniref:Polysaccharide deacetylase family protein n=1 Tax=Paenibacillus lutrae TaxID=2078573 RepID=A0A7X3JYL5_9BACL|nr:polysaccharide deacetylase family protein [Paenibacillus lutrae]MVO99107.1 polysaccharide deacetylase family protein [Paenibacillus lutrae]
MQKKKLLLLGLVAIGHVWLLQSESIHVFVQNVQQGKSNSPIPESRAHTGSTFTLSGEDSSKEEDELMKQIREEAPKLYVPPVDAKVDRIWKAIPGYNGLEVDIDRTYEAARKQRGSAPLPFLMKQVAPEVHLDQLGPEPIYKGNPAKPMVSFMINVAWGDEFIPGILESLRNEHVKATFFFDGSWLKKNVELAKVIQAEGHELSNHAYSHKNMSTLSRSKAYEEIVKTEELLKHELGVTNTLFAPPSGDFDKETVKIAAELKLKTVLWTLDTVDWKNPGAPAILAKVRKNIEPGTLILMHPTASSRAAMPEMIRIIKGKGLQLGTVSQTISPERLSDPSKPVPGSGSNTD